MMVLLVDVGRVTSTTRAGLCEQSLLRGSRGQGSARRHLNASTWDRRGGRGAGGPRPGRRVRPRAAAAPATGTVAPRAAGPSPMSPRPQPARQAACHMSPGPRRGLRQAPPNSRRRGRGQRSRTDPALGDWDTAAPLSLKFHRGNFARSQSHKRGTGNHRHGAWYATTARGPGTQCLGCVTGCTPSKVTQVMAGNANTAHGSHTAALSPRYTVHVRMHRSKTTVWSVAMPGSGNVPLR